MRGSNKTLAELSRGVTLYPQQLINVKVQKGFDFHAITSIKAAQTKAKRDLGDQGRILLRASGTEPLVRVMVEGKSKQKVKYWVEYISNTLRNAANR
jgi:phosphoglucosamine mutase